MLTAFAIYALCASIAGGTSPQKPYENPIIRGFSPDPSCIRVGDRFFCVNSSFNAFPGIPVYTSRDLVQWEQIGNVLAREEQLPELGQEFGFTSGIWANTIRHHNGTFYVTTTLVWDKLSQTDPTRWDNLLFKTDDIFASDGNGWSNAVHINPSFEGYDMSLFWDDDGKTYIQGSHAYHVQPGIWQYEIDLDTGTISNEEVLWTGTGGLAPEGPHIYKKDGFYYLMIAEGGTGLGHMETMARSNGSIHGPYVPYVNNPVLTNANTSEYLQTLGHADIFDDIDGHFWAVALATRNGSVDFPMGRETVLVPVVWEEGQFPVFDPANPRRAMIHMEGPLPPAKAVNGGVFVGQDQSIDLTRTTALPRQLVYLRYPDMSKFVLSKEGLCLYGSSANLTGPDGISGTSTFVGRRQEHVEFMAEADLDLDASQWDIDQEAGVTVFLQQLQHFDLGVVRLDANSTSTNGLSAEPGFYVRLKAQTLLVTNDGMSDPLSSPGMQRLPHSQSSLTLRIQAVNETKYEFSYATRSSGEFKTIGFGDASEVSGGFTGTIIGMYATGDGKNSTSPACFTRFDYRKAV
ncbi:hypothetical protein PUNSTDRAFT_101826 [Punctularia strigosozonata HHB-11173 SS5]|uniref:uncharacterized protein n=1 Tax=Punctularia strigosozonata (strain HHB-11173) TaxID=741275 RepID=UPI0004416BB4|nr:uncharacterized protein PUNSTDRAFT_101826 [Punctularia strigosozonata HHB-11173 SS5]EIN10122.1 hypothetical protein PUNSTDRAFT_101826 [Punctularia strigosozonata HHB-11173 SS5]